MHPARARPYACCLPRYTPLYHVCNPSQLPLHTGIRTVVSAMLKAIPALGNVFMVAMLIYFIFAILAINIVGGKFWSCRSMDDVREREWPWGATYLWQ